MTDFFTIRFAIRDGEISLQVGWFWVAAFAVVIWVW
jgi:hypothetical protein